MCELILGNIPVCHLPKVYCKPASIQYDVDPVCPHRAIVNLLQSASTQCDADPGVPIELLSTYFKLPLIQCDADPVCVP